MMTLLPVTIKKNILLLFLTDIGVGWWWLYVGRSLYKSK